MMGSIPTVVLAMKPANRSQQQHPRAATVSLQPKQIRSGHCQQLSKGSCEVVYVLSLRFDLKSVFDRTASLLPSRHDTL
eukprot:329742-Pelagomonas_calceolata.AAC.4